MEKVKLGLKDWKILSELDIDCRRSDSEIGRAVGLSQQVVGYRISKLVKSGVIRQFYAVVDVTKLGYSIYKVYFKLQNMGREKEDELRIFLLNHRNVLWAGSCDGAWDLSMTLVARTEMELDGALRELLGRFGANILYKTVLLVVEAPHFLRGPDAWAKTLNFGRSDENVALDDIDKGILAIVSTKARMPYVEIAEKAGITIDVVKYRMKKLAENGILKGFRIWVDTELVGKRFYKLLLSLQNASREREVALLEYCRANPSVTYALKTIGAWDMEMEFQADGHRAFHDEVAGLRDAFHDIIRSYEPLPVFEEYKFNYWPFQGG